MDELRLFSDDLPVRLPVWHSVQSSNKKFSRLRNQFDLDVVPDYGGHMLNYDKIKGEFKQIKHDHLNKSPFLIRSHLTPHLISLESTDHVPNNKPNNRCLVYDREQLVSTLSFNHPKKKELIIQHLHSADQGDFDRAGAVYREYLDASYGNIEQLNKFVNVGPKVMTHVRQERCVNLYEFKKASFKCDDEWIKLIGFIPKNSNEYYLHSDHNAILGQYLITASALDKQMIISELDIEQKTKFWSITLAQVDQTAQVNYSKYHPRTFYLTTTDNVTIFDTRFKSTSNLNVSRTKLRSLSSIERFRQFSNSNSDSNQLFIASDYNLMLFDVRYPNYVLMQWSHMLSSDSEVSFINCVKLEVDSVFVATREEVACISIDKPSSLNLIQPTSLHFPVHLPKLKNLIKNSTVTDLRLEQYVDEFKIVGLDFVVNDGPEFDFYLMNQYGDVFKQKLSKTNLESSYETLIQLEPNSTEKLDCGLKMIKEKLLQRRRDEVANKSFFENRKLKAGTWRPADRTYWRKFADDLKLDDDDMVRQELNCSKDELDTTSLIEHLETNLANVKFIDKLQKTFKENTKDFVSKDVSNYKWSEYTQGLFESWNLKQDDPIDESNDEHSKASQTLSQNLTQEYILSQYI